MLFFVRFATAIRPSDARNIELLKDRQMGGVITA